MFLSVVRRAFSKLIRSPQEGIQHITSGQTVAVGGFGICGVPMNLIHELSESSLSNLTVISNTAGTDDWGVGVLLHKPGKVKRVIGSYFGNNAEFQRQYLQGELEVELIPQGTLAQKLKSQSAGLPGFYTPTGCNTLYSTGKLPIKYKKGGKDVEIYTTPREVKQFHGRSFILEESLQADVALIKAHIGDTKGNLVFNKSAQNFNPDMAGAAKIVVAEVDKVVEVGQIDPNLVQLSGVFVNYVLEADPKSRYSTKKIEKLMYHREDNVVDTSPAAQARIKIAKRAAKEVRNGMSINLGIGMPTLMPAYLPADIDINLQSEDGILGVGDYPLPGEEDPDLVNAGKESVTVKPGACYFSSSTSFEIIRGGHLDMTMLGSLQVSEKGDIANWIIPGKMVKGMGGAMDLVASGSRVIVTMEHTAKGAPKLLKECTLPLTASGVASMVITEKAVFQLKEGKLVLTEIAKESSLEDIRKTTQFELTLADNIKRF